MLEAAGREDQMTGTESMIRAAPAGGEDEGCRLPSGKVKGAFLRAVPVGQPRLYLLRGATVAWIGGSG